MKLDVQAYAGLLVITVDEDRIDASVALAFKEGFRSLISENTGDVLLDLGKVDFLDSSGLGALVAARKLMGTDRALDLAQLRPIVAKVMRLTHMDSVFTIHSTCDTALAAHGVTSAG
ncbi:STAS domain-containing protein [Rhodophyticola sp. SM2404]